MKEKRDCNIVQDLLPNYIEKLTNEETNQFIEEHLKECEECKKTHENMKKEFELNTTKRDKREVKYIKKYSNKLKILKIILAIVLIVFIVVIGIKFIIIKDMQSKIEKYKDIDNFHVTMHTYQGDAITVTNFYHKDDNFLAHIKVIDEKNDREIISTKNGNSYLRSGETKVAIKGESPMVTQEKVYNYLETENIGEFIIGLFKTNISSVKCNDKDCYKIDNFKTSDILFPEQGLCVYIDKETGLIVRVEQGDRNNGTGGIFTSVTDYEYEFNTVTDENLKEPDVSGYTIQSQN